MKTRLMLSDEATEELMAGIQNGTIRVFDFDAPAGQGISETGSPEWRGMIVVKQNGCFAVRDYGHTTNELYIKPLSAWSFVSSEGVPVFQY